MKQDNNPNFEHFPNIGFVMATKMVAGEKIKPRFIYREKPIRDEDSGWRIFTGQETDEYVDNTDNSGVYAPTTILNIDPSIETLLLQGIGSVFEKSDDGTWHRVTDFEMEDDYMTTHRLVDNWIIDINNLFIRQVEEDGSLLYTTDDKSVRLMIFHAENMDKQQLYAHYKDLAANRDQSDAKTQKTFELSDTDIARLGYLISENDGDKAYSVIYGFSIIDHEVMEVVLYFDNPDAMNWAMDTWKSVRIYKE